MGAGAGGRAGAGGVDASLVPLVAGYALAVPFSVYVPGFLRLWRRREPLVFAAEELGAALIVAGFAARRSWPAVVVNGGWGVGLAVAWVAEGRRRARR